MEIRSQLRQYFEDIQDESGAAFSKWRVAIEPDLRTDDGYPALCYWLFDGTGKAHAFSFRYRADQPDLAWVRGEIKAELFRRSTQE